MQLLKNKKGIIACVIAFLIIVLVVVMVVMRNTHHNKKYIDGEMTLVDIIAKGTEQEAKVYITKNQELLLDIKNARNAMMYLSEKKDPVYDTSTELNLENNGVLFTVSFRNKLSYENAEEAMPLFPCSCELSVQSDVSGLEYHMSVVVDDDLEYVKGSIAKREVNYSSVDGYDEFVKEIGPVRLPENAMLVRMISRQQEYEIGEECYQIPQAGYRYELDGRVREVLVVRASDGETVKQYYCEGREIKVLTVNGVEVSVLMGDVDDYCIALYTIGEYTYVNEAFCFVNSKTNDKELIQKLTPFIG